MLQPISWSIDQLLDDDPATRSLVRWIAVGLTRPDRTRGLGAGGSQNRNSQVGFRLVYQLLLLGGGTEDSRQNGLTLVGLQATECLLSSDLYFFRSRPV